MIKTDEYNGVCVISVIGELTGDDCGTTRKTVETQIDTHHVVSFAIDLEQCTFIDSDGLETLLWVKRKCDELFGMMKVVKPDENCRKILQITRLESRFDVEADLSLALKGIR